MVIQQSHCNAVKGGCFTIESKSGQIHKLYTSNYNSLILPQNFYGTNTVYCVRIGQSEYLTNSSEPIISV